MYEILHWSSRSPRDQLSGLTWAYPASSPVIPRPSGSRSRGARERPQSMAGTTRRLHFAALRIIGRSLSATSAAAEGVATGVPGDAAWPSVATALRYFDRN